MKKLLKSILLLTVNFFLFITIFGCVQTVEKFKTDMAAKEIQPLTVAEIKLAFTEHTMLGKHSKYDWSRYLASDGIVKSRVWGGWGEELATGRWWTNKKGMLCINLDNDKYKYGDRCSIVYPGKQKNQYTHIIAIGKKSKSVPDGIYNYRLVPGNQSGLP